MSKSKRWSMKDIRKIESFIKIAKKAGLDKKSGMQAAAEHFGVTLNAVHIRYDRFVAGEQTSNLKLSTTKVPMVRKKRKYTKRESIHPVSKAEEATGRSMTFKITNVQVDLNKGTITVSY